MNNECEMCVVHEEVNAALLNRVDELEVENLALKEENQQLKEAAGKSTPQSATAVSLTPLADPSVEPSTSRKQRATSPPAEKTPKNSNIDSIRARKARAYALDNSKFELIDGFLQVRANANHQNVDVKVAKKKPVVNGSRGKACLACCIQFFAACNLPKDPELFDADFLDSILMQGES